MLRANAHVLRVAHLYMITDLEVEAYPLTLFCVCELLGIN